MADARASPSHSRRSPSLSPIAYNPSRGTAATAKPLRSGHVHHVLALQSDLLGRAVDRHTPSPYQG